MVFQDYALYPQMTVYQNLAFGAADAEDAEGRDRPAGAAARPRCSTSASCCSASRAQLSGGQRQRVALGRALVREPQVFLMDEPLSNLDAKLRVQTRSEIKHLQQQVGTTTVYVTHDQVEAMTMGDRVAVMSEGVLEQVGDPRTVYEQPANVFVAGFIGSPAMSFATVQATRNGDALTLSRGELSLTLPSARVPEGVPAEVIAGIRPEHCHLWRDGPGLLGPIAGRDGVRRAVGARDTDRRRDEQDLHFTVLAEPDAATKPGDEVRFGVEPGRLHLFDTETELALSIA